MRVSMFGAIALMSFVATTQQGHAARNVLRAFSASQWDKGFVEVSGSWVEGSREADVNAMIAQEAVTITCVQRLGLCIESRAQLSATLDLLAARADLYDIQTWTAGQIQTKPMREPCGLFQITIARESEKVFSTKTGDANRASGCDGSSKIELLELKTKP